MKRKKNKLLLLTGLFLLSLATIIPTSDGGQKPPAVIDSIIISK